jgi:peptidoglycan glycosyltransferase
MNRALLRLSLACLGMFVLLLVNVNYVQAFRTTSLADAKGNVRVFNQQFKYQRGSIKAGSKTIAASHLVKGNSGNYQRYYPDPEVYAPITGYSEPFGRTGLEEAENSMLSGTDPKLTVHNLVSLVTGHSRQGGTVYTTVVPGVQQAAYAALKAEGRESGVVALDPKTGAILAMASFPSFDPNKYVTLTGKKLERVDKALQLAPGHPLLNHTTQLTYPPGSSFKVITSSAALSQGKVAGPQSTVPAPTQLKLGSKALINDGGEACGDGHPQLIFAFTLSCNTAFGLLGQKVTGPVLHDYANKFGFNNSKLTIPLPVTPSVFPPVTDPAFTAYQAIGQFSDRVTPLQEAMIAATIANGGTMMKPYLVKEVQAPDLSPVLTTTPQELGSPISPTVASQLTQMMVSVTNNPAGTAYATANQNVAGVEIAGKTGTAQNGINNTNLDDAVFTCFAPASNPVIAVGVIVKGGGFGADAAAPIAVKVIQEYLREKGMLP